jgi:hypothetical protein
MNPPSTRRRSAAKPLADMIGQAMAPALAAKGFAGREIIAGWAGIVGERLAARSRPLKIDWPRIRPGADGDRGEPATLVVLVESAFAPELQHAAPLLMARINAHLGWPALGKVALRQGPVAQGASRRPAPPALEPEAVARVEHAAQPIAGPELRDAVTRLGLAISRRAAAATRGTGENV